MELLYQHQHKQVCEAQKNSWLVSKKQLVQIQIAKSSVFRKQVWEGSYTKRAYTVEITADEYQSLKK